jgi:hypothetical protein
MGAFQRFSCITETHITLYKLCSNFGTPTIPFPEANWLSEQDAMEDEVGSCGSPEGRSSSQKMAMETFHEGLLWISGSYPLVI